MLSLLAIFCVDAQKPIKPVKKEISVEDVKFAVFERDLNEPKEYITAKLSEKLPNAFQADQHRKIQLKFTVKDRKATTPINVHQAFVVMVHGDSQREVIYVAEPDQTTKAYNFELDLKTHHKDFSGVSGKYTLRLILGDAAVSNPIDWTIAEVSVTVPSMQPAALPKSKQVSYDKLPEIKHQFREPEQQPPVIVSHVFGALCAAPFLILLALWLRIGINFGNAKFSLWP
uniref:Dolichyl-diphosphooligosaccharide--protein glycosyltransferase subunit 2 n=1 Tax=Ditylenchus dipsaci TaxID=166011 RepID=A0A915DKM2_9BILA